MKFAKLISFIFVTCSSLLTFAQPGSPASETSPAGFVGMQKLPTFGDHYFYSKYLTAKYFTVSGPGAYEAKTPVFMAFQVNDKDWAVYNTGILRTSAHNVRMNGRCQALANGGAVNKQQDNVVFVSEENISTTPKTVDVYALTNFSYNMEQRIYSEICDRAKEPVAIKTLFPNAQPFASFPIAE